MDSVRRRTELVEYLKRFNLPVAGTVSVLRGGLRKHLKDVADKIEHLDRVQLTQPLGKLSAICTAGGDLLLCADDGRKTITQVALEYDGVTVLSNTTLVVSYPYISRIESMTVLNLLSYFDTTTRTRSSNDEGDLFRCCLQTGRIEAVVNEANHPGSAVKQVAAFERIVVLSDSKRQGKEHNPEIDSVQVILGDGKEGESDGTGETCRFLNGICTMEKTIFATDVASGMIKMASGLSGTVSFLKMLGSLCDSFGIHAKDMRIDKITLQHTSQNVARITSYFKETTAKVKEPYALEDTSQGTISHKTQQSLGILIKGLPRLVDNLLSISLTYADNVNLETLLTTMVENAHAVSHFKHEIAVYCRMP